MSENDPNALSVTAFDPASPETALSQPDEKANRSRLQRWGSFAAAVLALSLVFIVLPRWIGSPPTLITEKPIPEGVSSSSTTAQTRSSESESSERSPYAEAQLARDRRSAQEALQLVLELQENLQSLGVELWDNENYQLAIANAPAGDTAYGERHFEEATSIYQSIADALLVIEQKLPVEVALRLSDLTLSIEQSDADKASLLGSVLELMAPDRADVAAALNRIQYIEPIKNLLATASELTDQELHQEALRTLKQAAALDPAHQRVSALVRRAEQSVNDQSFQHAMSEGFNKLEQNRFDLAETAFQRAASLKPGSESVSAAFQELKAAVTVWDLNKLKAKGSDAEITEDWAEALGAYQEAIRIDPSVIFARDGLARVEPIAEAETALTQIVENIDRLVDAAVRENAEKTISEAKELVTVGTKFAALLNKAMEVVTIANTPQRVTLISDGNTEVFIKRISRLLPFDSTTVMLHPGKYEALGRRDGYREVLVPFTVVSGVPLTVDIRCVEAIKANE